MRGCGPIAIAALILACHDFSELETEYPCKDNPVLCVDAGFAQFQLELGGPAGFAALAPMNCPGLHWRFPAFGGAIWGLNPDGSIPDAGAPLRLRNTGDVPIAYQFRQAWRLGVAYLPDTEVAHLPLEVPPVFGVLEPGGELDISNYKIGIMGIVGSYRPFSEVTATGDEGVTDWPRGSLSWQQGGQPQTHSPMPKINVATVTAGYDCVPNMKPWIP